MWISTFKKTLPLAFLAPLFFTLHSCERSEFQRVTEEAVISVAQTETGQVEITEINPDPTTASFNNPPATPTPLPNDDPICPAGEKCETDDCTGPDCDPPTCTGSDCDPPTCTGSDCDPPTCAGSDCDPPTCPHGGRDDCECPNDKDCDDIDDPDDPFPTMCTDIILNAFGVSAATIFLNEEEIFDRAYTPNDFKNGTIVGDRRSINLQKGTNTVGIDLRGSPGDYFDITIVDCTNGQDAALYSRRFSRTRGAPTRETDEFEFGS